MNEIIETLLRGSNELEEAYSQLENFQSTLNTDPQELDNIENRLYSIRNLSRKIKCDPNKLFEFYIDLKNKINMSGNKDDMLEKLEADFLKKLRDYKESCINLRKARIITAIKIR